MEETRRETQLREKRAFLVRVSEGATIGSEVRVEPQRAAPLRIGVAPTCDLSLVDPKVSRHHLSLEVVEDLLRVVDERSTNGTWLGATRVGEAWLRGGELLRLGDTRLAIEAVAPAPSKRAQRPEAAGLGRIVGSSNAMRAVYPLMDRFARTDDSLVVEGEVGTGKELAAETIHELSSRRDGPFVSIDASTLDKKDADATLFGIEERGTRKGAVHKGALEEASGGTLVIADVAHLSPVTQAKLIRALERAEISRVNTVASIKINTRVLVTSKKSLEREVELGRFREDLYYRLAVGRLEMPPLRRREGDAAILAAHFWQKLARGRAAMPTDMLAGYCGYAWPGNVREVRHLVTRHLALGPLGKVVATADAPTVAPVLFERMVEEGLSLPEARARVTGEFERFYVQRSLEKHQGNLTHAAAASGVALRYFRLLRGKHREL